jgi:hypothetical protein
MAQTLVAIVSAVLVLAWAPAASAQIWSAAGATGAVDESDRSMYVFGSNGAVAIRSSIARGTLNLRYPVQTVPNLLIPQGDCPEMRVLLRDTGAGGRVVVRLMQLGIAGGFEGSLEQVAEINSDGLQPVGDPNQYHSHRACLDTLPDNDFLFDLSRFTYFVEVQLTKTAATANPGLMAIQICPSQGACDP